MCTDMEKGILLLCFVSDSLCGSLAGRVCIQGRSNLVVDMGGICWPVFGEDRRKGMNGSRVESRCTSIAWKGIGNYGLLNDLRVPCHVLGQYNFLDPCCGYGPSSCCRARAASHFSTSLSSESKTKPSCALPVLEYG
ncbi:hypothetical protein N657DRAFT_219695 [Parathielavia appendiculata]|uniref:Secreted protein n=1 Tax=Parathielavia appendiculata TaxID=2587402 RepID=A0AAN6U7I8_9PEZI|nr:hypothetical protein N657DRAFT_219695 [Parathielavia appendiculata]